MNSQTENSDMFFKISETTWFSLSSVKKITSLRKKVTEHFNDLSFCTSCLSTIRRTAEATGRQMKKRNILSIHSNAVETNTR